MGYMSIIITEKSMKKHHTITYTRHHIQDIRLRLLRRKEYHKTLWRTLNEEPLL